MNEGDPNDVPVSEWIFSKLTPFKNIYMPPSTVYGMERVMALPIVKEKKDSLKMLNMTELTPLAKAMPYKLETGSDIPLWVSSGSRDVQSAVTCVCTKDPAASL